MWQLQGLHGCYGVYVAVMESRYPTLFREKQLASYGTDLHEGVTMPLGFDLVFGLGRVMVNR